MKELPRNGEGKSDTMNCSAFVSNHHSSIDLNKGNVVISCYEVIRNDIDILATRQFNYVVLDEGHLIKNTKTRLTLAVKRLKAMHRLILSGTPIQNRVNELWSLVDFLMPGYLSTEKEFSSKYARPIAASRNAKSSSKDQEAGAIALDALHKQVLPFLLRRMKEDVLDDLPPKIIQDYFCNLTPLQQKLYSKIGAGIDASSITYGSQDEEAKDTPHIFQTLQEMRKICNHPIFALNPQHAMYEEVMREKGDLEKLVSLEYSGKLVALHDLLVELGFTSSKILEDERDNNSNNDATTTEELDVDLRTNVVASHRVLIFAQVKSMLDLIEKCVFQERFPSLSHRRIDGGTAPMRRQEIVREFNSDPSIDVLLLTTTTGGLGLNLTGADTVIFVEQDWNPMKDLQARTF